MNSFTKKVVLITGAGKGLGRKLAEAFVERGAFVAANDIAPINLDDTVAAAQKAAARSSGKIKDYVIDVSKKMPIQAFINQVLDDWGRIDILINHAAVKPKHLLLEMDEWDWQRTLDVNLSAPFFMTQVVGRVMRAQGGGVILNVIPDWDVALGPQGKAAFLATQAGLQAITRQAAIELQPDNIRVNAILAERKQELLPPDSPSNGKNPDFNTGLTNLVLFLCSSEAAAVTGQVFSLGHPD